MPVDSAARAEETVFDLPDRVVRVVAEEREDEQARVEAILRQRAVDNLSARFGATK